VAGDYASEKKISLLTVMEKKAKKIHALMQGQTIPFNAMFVIRVWDKTRDGLNAKAGAIKNAINSMNAAQYFESNLPAPPGICSSRPGPAGRGAATNTASSTPNIVTWRTAAGDEAPSPAPGHRRSDLRRPASTWSASAPSRRARTRACPQTPCCWVCRARKSVRFVTCSRRRKGYFGYTVIIEEGLSYGIYTATVQEGEPPVLIHPDGDLTINYLDTKGCP